MQIDTDKYFVHANGWWWGSSYDIILKDGSGMISVQFDYDKPNTCFLSGLSVLEEYRRKGIGRSLIELSEDLARHEGMKFVELTVEYYNEWLFKWYVSMGYTPISRDSHVVYMLKVI